MGDASRGLWSLWLMLVEDEGMIHGRMDFRGHLESDGNENRIDVA